MNGRTGFNARSGLLIGLICVPIFIGALDLTVVSAILPHVINDLEIPLQSGLDNASWIVTGYLLAYSVSMTFMGRLSDLKGRRVVFLIALAIFMVGSYLVAVADTWPTRLGLQIYYWVSSGRPDVSYVTLDVLITARMIQAFGAGSMVPVGMALVGDLYPPGKRARLLGLIAAVDTMGWVVGHLYGGILVRYWDWQMIFWLNLPICFLALVIIWFLLRGIPQDKNPGKMDWGSVLLLAASLTFLNLGLGSSQQPGASVNVDGQTSLNPRALPLLVGAVLLLLFFIIWQKRSRDPLIDLDLFRLRNYPAASIANFLIGISLFIAIANVPIFINSLVASSIEQGAWDSGWMLSSLTIPLAVASIPGGILSDRFGYRLPAVLGLILAIIGFSLMQTWQIGTSYSMMIPHLILCGSGIGLTMAPIAAALINSSPSLQRGTSSALVIIFRLIGMTLGVSMVTSYDLIRFEKISDSLLQNAATQNDIFQVGLLSMQKVISETFIMAGIVAVIALVPALFLKAHSNTNKEVYDG
ncbi:MAG TPA: MFS transporter [Anaerolineales bacterium]|nr:MFS transporter [Anaerolineales bacterium]